MQPCIPAVHLYFLGEAQFPNCPLWAVDFEYLVELTNDAIALRVDLSLIRRGKVLQGRKIAGRGLGQKQVRVRNYCKHSLERKPHICIKLAGCPEGREGRGWLDC